MTARPRVVTTTPRRVLIAHHHRIVLESLETALRARGYVVVGAVPECREAVLLAASRRPDVILLGAPDMDGIETTRQILRASPHSAVILLGSGEQAPLEDALRDGVRGLVVDAQGTEDLVNAIETVSRGGIHVSAAYAGTVVGALNAPAVEHGCPLSAREVEMLRLTCDGKTKRQAAQLMGISIRTAEAHGAHIKEKLGIRDTAGLVRYAIRQGLIDA
jgi:DNA-binding NarL/FixJ family response regulator